MDSPLIATKLHSPPLRPQLVARPRLAERMRRGLGTRLTLVSAPAGFGKTTLLAASFAADDAPPAAWLSLDRADNEPVAFWTQLIAALQRVAPGLGADAQAALAAGTPATEPLLAHLINELHAHPGELALVLDDYHLVERPQIHQGLGFLIERMPPGLHIVVGTRADPPLPLARLRARGELVELRAADLRFTPDEARTYLNDTARLGLLPADVTALAQRTEGWIAALQLAALSLEGRADPTAFIAGFAGDDRYIVDYLLEEVLQRQPEPIRRFLGRTCFLDRLSGPLCDAVTGETGGSAMLEALVCANLFVLPLDPRREWYRYHHLFADVLRTWFAAELRDGLPTLHARASRWFAAHDALPEAIGHALAARDFDAAAGFIERAIPLMRQSRQEATLRNWLETLPDAAVRARPVLGAGLVGVLMSVGAFDGIEGRLDAAERAITAEAAGDGTVLVTDRTQLPGLPAAIELYRAALAQVRSDVPAVVIHAERTIALAPPDERLARAGAHGFLGIARWTLCELEPAAQSWTACRDGLRQAGHLADVFGASIALADINLTLGRVRAAARIYDDALALSGPLLRGAADAHAGLSELHRLSGDLDLAAEHLDRSQELGEAAGLPQFPYRWRVAMAGLRLAAGDPEAALDLLDEAERAYVPDFFPRVRPIPALRARILIRQGRLAEAARWRAEAGIDAADEPSFLHEYEHVTLARLLLARGDPAAALNLLDSLHAAAQAGGRLGSVIEISVVAALARDALKDGAAQSALEPALILAQSEGFVSVFTDEGAPMAALLKPAAKRNAYARVLLSHFDAAPAPNPPASSSR